MTVGMMLRNVLALVATLTISCFAVAAAAPAEKKTAESGPDIAAASRQRAMDVVQNMVDSGTTDVDELVDTIATENAEKLDHIIINLANQTLYECNMTGQVLRTHKVSSGRKGYDTPPGTYKIENRSPKAYSKKYDAWMLNWMGFTPDGNYGIHGLEGSSYERHLGSVASHGCIRLSRKNAKDLYTRIKVGMPVKIVNDAKLALQDYTPITREAALTMVLEVLSPADPHEIFY
jgi:lipoprotein-anchoring transpeptidase ErfK/SrfK